MKTLSGAIIPYGSTLPTAISSADGSLFYKTDSVGGPSGLYLYGFIADSNPGLIGSQVAQGWIQAVSPDLFVLKTGDTMTGALTVPGFLRVTALAGGQRILIGNQDSGGTNRPSIIQGANGAVTIGFGSTWSGNGGTLTPGLGIDVGAGAVGLTYQAGQVWHVGNHGIGSGLNADLLDGQQGSFYQNASNINTGVLAVANGGTGISTGPTNGGIVYGVGGVYSSSAGTTGQVMISQGTSAPIWVSQSALTVGNATYATSAGSATTAGTATNATNAANVPWTGITGLPTAVQTFGANPNATTTAYARPSLHFDMGGSGALSLTPAQFPPFSISGFSAYSTSDMGNYQTGLTVVGTGGAYGLQIAANWDVEEAAPAGLRFRVNDDTGTIGSWGAFRTIWDQGNLTNLSQLTNGPGFITSAALGSYVLKAGDTMTGGLTTTALAINASLGAAGTLTTGSSITCLGFMSASGNVISTSGYVLAQNSFVQAGNPGSSGSITLRPAGTLNSGYVEFNSFAGVRQGYIGFSASTGAQDTGTLPYIAGTHAFSGAITATGNVTAYASDGRLKKNVAIIENAVQKVLSLGGYSYDWDMVKCNEIGFKPVQEHEHGLIAQEVARVMPDAVAPAPFDSKYLTVRYERIVALLTAAMGEQQKQIEALMAKVEALEAK